MAGHHDEHHSLENKPVSFTVPFILASVTIIITLLFLSLCDPKPHHQAHENEAHTHPAAAATDHSNSDERQGQEAAHGTSTTQGESAAPADAHH